MPSKAACKSTCKGTCPGIVSWTEPAGPTSCLKYSADAQWTVAAGAKTEVHRRQQAGTTRENQCDFCTKGLTFNAAVTNFVPGVGANADGEAAAGLASGADAGSYGSVRQDEGK